VFWNEDPLIFRVAYLKREILQFGEFIVKYFVEGESQVDEKLVRIGTTYIPVQNVEVSTEWYTSKLGANLRYKDGDKAILNMANQSIFLVKAKEGQLSNFIDCYGNERFSLTFEVDGLAALKELHQGFLKSSVQVGQIEDRGHSGKNFVFCDLDGNKFDVWSELSSEFKERYSK
jgi:catechol 2,3-dioxygenase-like lactoylglutathione lyase family enzyme